MDTINFLALVFFTGLCLLVYIAVFAVIAIVSTRAKIRYANQILKAQSRGAFANLETPKNKSRFRLLAALALIGVLGMGLSIAVLVLQMAAKFSNLYGITIAIALIFGVLGATAGLLMQREINRRL